MYNLKINKLFQEEIFEAKISNDLLNNDYADDKLDLCVTMIIAYISVNYSKNDFDELREG